MYSPYLATSKESAIEAILAQQFKLVQLNYKEGALDMKELSLLGRKNDVATSFISQVRVDAKNIFALKRELKKENDSYQQRYIFCAFEMSDEDILHCKSLARKQGDVLIMSLVGDEIPLYSIVWE